MKGISTLISAVLLLAVTVSAVGVFSSWAPGLVQDITEDTENQTEQQVQCNQASIDIEAGKYYSGNSVTTAVIRNTGTVNLDSIRVEAWNNDLPLSQNTVGVNKGNFTSTNVSTSESPTSIRAVSTKCSNAQDTFEDIQ
jgi:flagellin-like protein